MIELLLGWLKRYPIASIEDPLAEDDIDGFREFAAKAGDRVQIVGDDLLVTDAERVHRIAALGAANALLVKPNQRGTLTETKAAFDAARIAGFDTIVSARSGETEDVTIAHLAVGWNAGQLKVGSFARSERMAKWNEVLRIEQELDGQGRLPGALHFEGESGPALSPAQLSDIICTLGLVGRGSGPEPCGALAKEEAYGLDAAPHQRPRP